MLIASLLAGCGQMPVNGDASVMGDSGPVSTMPGRCDAPDGTAVPRTSVCPDGYFIGCAYSDDARIQSDGAGGCVSRGVFAPSAICTGGIPTPGTIDHVCPTQAGTPQWRCVPLLDGCAAPQ